MKKVILMAAAIIAFASCERELPPVEEPPKVSTDFTYNGIQYLFDEESGEQYVDKNAPQVTVSNNTSIEQTYNYDSSEETFNSSEFWSGDEQAFKFVDERQKVPVPQHVSDTSIQCDYGTTWSYAEGEQRLKPNMWSVSPIRIPPHSVLVLNATYRYKSLTARYRLNLRGVEAGEDITSKDDGRDSIWCISTRMLKSSH
jgi:hypothetical protein